MLLVTDADLAHIRSTYPYLQVKRLSNQQEKFLLFMLRGQSKTAAANAVGANLTTVNNWLREENFQRIIEYFRQHEFADVRVTRETLTNMLFEAHAHATSATEEISAIRELGKMHDLYESDKHKRVQINNTTVVANITNTKQIERLDDVELLKLAGFDSLDPVPSTRDPVVIDHDTVE